MSSPNGVVRRVELDDPQREIKSTLRVLLGSRNRTEVVHPFLVCTRSHQRGRIGELGELGRMGTSELNRTGRTLLSVHDRNKSSLGLMLGDGGHVCPDGVLRKQVDRRHGE